jgi:hypothetical protein
MSHSWSQREGCAYNSVDRASSLRPEGQFKRGDQIESESEGGRVRGVIVKKVGSNLRFKGYLHFASKDEPQYIIKSDKIDHIAIHKGKALKHVKALARRARVRRNS